MTQKLILSGISLLLATQTLFAQATDSTLLHNQSSDSLQTRLLSEITIVGAGSKSDIHQLPQIVGTNIYAGKKSSLVVLDNVQGNIVTNTMRQILAKVPGIFIWESEGSGIQPQQVVGI
jgi:Fe(3+) dicitrate transport protein